MVHEPKYTIRARRLRALRSQGVVMVAPVEVGQGGVELLVGNGLLKQHQADDRQAVGETCLAALEQVGRRPWRTVHGTGLEPSDGGCP